MHPSGAPPQVEPPSDEHPQEAPLSGGHQQEPPSGGLQQAEPPSGDHQPAAHPSFGHPNTLLLQEPPPVAALPTVLTRRHTVGRPPAGRPHTQPAYRQRGTAPAVADPW